MRRTLAMASAVCLLVASAGSADFPRPELKGYRFVDPRVSFEGIDKHTDYVFYLRYLTWTGKNRQGLVIPPTMILVKDSKAFSLKTEEYLTEVHLLAMDRKEFEKREKADPSLKWL